MKKTKEKSVKDMTVEELSALLAEGQETIRKIGFNEGMTRQKNVKEGRPAAALVARIKTELSRRANANA